MGGGAGGRNDPLQVDHGLVAELLEAASWVVDIGHPAAHASREIAPRVAKHHDDAAGHIFAAVVAQSFDDGHGAGVSNCKALSGHPFKIGFTGDRAIKHRVAHYDVAGGLATRLWGLAYDHAPPREAFADIIVGVADQLQS